ncbi:hypothetical protein [Kitasatospora sp. A2-31]|uniref:hypothetical protein n=1 Tax=Kitasatospora sp. A2-31 TaxID=2916414 RepID=UPI001EE8309A|nr:hypothetical protein [Kitasatospora sp. A2-31]MCG6492932.1 hypothetical protein [Kitasatospora sp. A2-31]
MTAHMITGVSDPCIHALVIGVGVYQNCGRSTPQGAPGRKLLKELGSPLTCAPLSAIHVARRLMEMDWTASTVKLGTIEVLLSSDSADCWPADLPQPSPKRALYDNVRTAWREWVDRCDQHPGNIALLYFCGHGWGGSYLLVEDFAAQINQWQRHVIDFNRTRQSMQTCNALTQHFFLDICSNEPDELPAMEIRPEDLLDDNRQEARRRLKRRETTPNNLVLRPTPNGFKSEVPARRVTRFADALMKTLDGLGATSKNNTWEIRSRDLPPRMAEVLDWFWPHLGAGDDLTQTPGDYGRDTLLRRCPGNPMVPFRLECRPHSARSDADWELECLLSNALHPQPQPGVWEAETEASSYRITANWNDGIHEPVTLKAVSIEPANTTASIEFDALPSNPKGG